MMGNAMPELDHADIGVEGVAARDPVRGADVDILMLEYGPIIKDLLSCQGHLDTAGDLDQSGLLVELERRNGVTSAHNSRRKAS
jgi:hypothetical protein